MGGGLSKPEIRAKRRGAGGGVGDSHPEEAAVSRLRLALSDGAYSSAAKNSDAVFYDCGSHLSVCGEALRSQVVASPYITVVESARGNAARPHGAKSGPPAARALLLAMPYSAALASATSDVDSEIALKSGGKVLSMSNPFFELLSKVATAEEMAVDARESKNPPQAFSLSLRSRSKGKSDGSNAESGSAAKEGQKQASKTKYRQMKTVLASLWQDKDLRWDDPEIVTSFAPGETIVSSWDGIEDTKGSNGFGLLIMTNLRCLWISCSWRTSSYLDAQAKEKLAGEVGAAKKQQQAEKRSLAQRLRRSQKASASEGGCVSEEEFILPASNGDVMIGTNISLGWGCVTAVESVVANSKLYGPDSLSCLISTHHGTSKFEFLFTGPPGIGTGFTDLVRKRFNQYQATSIYRDVLIRDPCLVSEQQPPTKAGQPPRRPLALIFAGERFISEWPEVQNVTAKDVSIGYLTITSSRMIWTWESDPRVVNVSIPFISMRSATMREVTSGVKASLVVTIMENFGGFVLGFACEDYLHTVQLFQLLRRLHVVSTLRPAFGPLTGEIVQGKDKRMFLRSGGPNADWLPNSWRNLIGDGSCEFAPPCVAPASAVDEALPRGNKRDRSKSLGLSSELAPPLRIGDRTISFAANFAPPENEDDDPLNHLPVDPSPAFARLVNTPDMRGSAKGMPPPPTAVGFGDLTTENGSSSFSQGDDSEDLDDDVQDLNPGPISCSISRAVGPAAAPEIVCLAPPPSPNPKTGKNSSLRLQVPSSRGAISQGSLSDINQCSSPIRRGGTKCEGLESGSGELNRRVQQYGRKLEAA